MGDEAPEEDIAPTVPVVEISKRENRPRSRTRRSHRDSDHYDDEDFDDIDDDDDDEDEDDVDDDDVDYTARSSPRRHGSPTQQQHHHHSRYKSLNGRRKVDMTPPDQKLTRSQTLAKKFARDGKADKAIEELVRCVAFSRIVYGPSHWKYAHSVITLGEAYLDLKGYHTQAEYHADTAKSIMLQGGHMTGSEAEKAELYAVLITIYRVLGQASTALKKYSEAEQAFQKADRISQDRSKLSTVSDRECDQSDILLFHAMARLYAKQKKYALASEKFDKVLSLMEAEYGTDSSQVMNVYLEYGKLELSKGKHANHEKAIQLFLQAHSIAAAIHKEGHPQLIDTALGLAQAYASTGWEEAEGSALSYLEESLSTCTTIHGPSHPKTLEVQDHLAKMMIRMDKSNDALQILRSSLELKAAVFGDYSEQVADTHKLIGSILLSQGSIEKALRAYKKCFTIESLLLGKNHRKTKDTQRTMEMLMASPSVSHKFVLNKEDELQKRPRFNSVVGRTKK